jgi:hypothetical protein
VLLSMDAVRMAVMDAVCVAVAVGLVSLFRSVPVPLCQAVVLVSTTRGVV